MSIQDSSFKISNFEKLKTKYYELKKTLPVSAAVAVQENLSGIHSQYFKECVSEQLYGCVMFHQYVMKPIFDVCELMFDVKEESTHTYNLGCHFMRREPIVDDDIIEDINLLENYKANSTTYNFGEQTIDAIEKSIQKLYNALDGWHYVQSHYPCIFE